MVTKSLAAFASPIITKAMETGGRGGTTITTDYSGIGDALMKKAQLELNAATLKADVAMKTQAMNTEARLKMIDIEDARIDKELADRRASKDMGFMEKTMGVLQGAMSGAQTGAAAGGGNPWAIAGGAVLGGAMAGHDAYSGAPGDEKRERMNKTNQTLGSIATIATTTRGMYDKYKGNEVFKSGTEDLGKLSKEIGQLSGAQQEAKIAEYNEKATAMQGELGKYFGPQESLNMMEGIRKGQSALLSNDPVTATKAKMAQVGTNLVAALEQPGADRMALMNQAHGEMNRLNGMLYGFDKKHQISPQEFSHVLGGIDPKLGEEYSTNIMGMSGGKKGGNVGSATSVRGTAQQIDPTTGAPVQQTNTNQPSMPVATGITGGTVHIPAGRGAVMDDGGSINPAQAEMDMAKNAQPAADAYNKMAMDEANNQGVVEDPVEKRYQELKKDPRTEGLKDKRIREIAEYEVKQKQEKMAVKSPESFQEAKKLAADADKRIKAAQHKTKTEGFTDPQDKQKMTNVNTAANTVDKMIEVIESGDYPSDSQMDAMSAKVRTEGAGEIIVGTTGAVVGGLAGGAIGSVAGPGGAFLGARAMQAGIAGVITGSGLGYKAGQKFPVGRGSKMTLSDSEANSVDKMSPLEQDFIFSYNKTLDEGVTREFEADEAKKLLPSPGQSRETQLKNLYRLKDRLASKAEGIAGGAEASNTGALKLEEKKEQVKQKYEANPQKRYNEAYAAEQAKLDFKSNNNVIDEEDQEDLQGQGGFFRLPNR